MLGAFHSQSRMGMSGNRRNRQDCLIAIHLRNCIFASDIEPAKQMRKNGYQFDGVDAQVPGRSALLREDAASRM